MAESEVSMEVSNMVRTEEKCGLDRSSSYNGTNQASDLDNSYVFVTGAGDGDHSDVSEGSSLLPESKAVDIKDQGVELDLQHEKLYGVSAEMNLGDVEQSHGGTPTLMNDGTGKHGSSSCKDGEEIQVSVSVEEHNGTSGEAQVNNQIENPDGETGSLGEAKIEKPFQNGIEHVARGEEEKFDVVIKSESIPGPPTLANDSIRKHESSSSKDEEIQVSVSVEECNGTLGEAQVNNQIYNPDGETDSLGEAEIQKPYQNGIEHVAQGKEEKFDVVIKPESIPGPPTLANDIIRKHESNSSKDGEEIQVSVSVEERNGTLGEAQVNNQIENPDGEIESFGEAKIEKEYENGIEHVTQGKEEKLDAVIKPESIPGPTTLVSDSTRKHESGSHKDGEEIQVPVEDHTGSSGEAEVNNQIENPDGDIESLGEAKVEEKAYRNGTECVVQGKEEKFDVVKIPESIPGPVENQESQVGTLGLVVDLAQNGKSNDTLFHMNTSHNANDECEDRINLSIADATSQEKTVDVIEPAIQDVRVEAEVKSPREVAEAAEHRVLPSNSLDLESSPVNNNNETHVEETKTTLGLDVLENQKGDTAVDSNVQSLLGLIDESETVMTSSTDCHVQTVCDLILEEKNEDSCEPKVENGDQYPEEPDGSGVSRETIPFETKSEASVQNQSYPATCAHAPQTETEISAAETTGAGFSPPVDGPKSQIIEKVVPGDDSGITDASNVANSGSDFTLANVVLTEKEPTFQGGQAHNETEASSKVADSAFATSDAKLEPEVHVHNFSTLSSEEKTDDVADACRTDVSDSLNISKDAANNMEFEGADDMGDHSGVAVGNGNENLFMQENEDTGNPPSKEVSLTSAGSTGANIIEREEESIKTKTKPFNFLIRIPRFDDENLREEIRLAKLHVDEKTKLRDAIQVQIQEIRANNQIYGIDYEYAKGEGRSARKLVRSKRMEIDSLQSVINKAKNALSIEDIDSQIYNMEHMIQHETLPLKEEKQLIREIKQLKQLREQLSSNMGSQDEIKQALEQREDAEERLKILRKELDILKNRVLKAEATAAEAEKKYDDENRKVKELQAHFRDADDVRQAAYAQWQSLRKELSKKIKHFFKYKDDAAIASNYAFSRDTEALYHLCINQVESFMELWNKNDEFRREYVRFNARSTVRRFGTLDGRSLGPDEEPLVLPSYADERVSRMTSAPVKVDLASQIPSLELHQEFTNESVTLKNSKLMTKVTEPKNQKVTKGAAIVQVNGFDSRDITTDEVYVEPPIKSREEVESIRKEEEMSRAEAEAKLKEQRRLEELEKANEARERKKRHAEKLQRIAELKTQKEAEQKEKEREKRLRKKERKKAAVTDANDTDNSETTTTTPSSESAVENSSKDMDMQMPKKQPQKHWLTAKQSSKAKSAVPPALRNRNKKKLQQWMWVGITSFFILVLFWLGNMGIFSNVSLKGRGGPVY